MVTPLRGFGWEATTIMSLSFRNRVQGRSDAAGVLTGFKDEDDWFDYKLENDPWFLDRIETARSSIRAGKGVRLEELEDDA